MECSICIEPIQEGSNISKTECGHVFHFPCLYRWNRTHTNCPMCRHEFGTFEEEAETPTYTEFLTGMGGMGRSSAMDMIQTILRSGVPEEHSIIPFDEFTRDMDANDVDLIMRHVPGLSRETVETYLRYYDGDIVDTIMYLAEHKSMPIPPFRSRDRPELHEPYVSPLARERRTIVRRAEVDPGYESC